jgi:hypothetical protein
MMRWSLLSSVIAMSLTVSGMSTGPSGRFSMEVETPHVAAERTYTAADCGLLALVTVP